MYHEIHITYHIIIVFALELTFLAYGDIFPKLRVVLSFSLTCRMQCRFFIWRAVLLLMFPAARFHNKTTGTVQSYDDLGELV